MAKKQGRHCPRCNQFVLWGKMYENHTRGVCTAYLEMTEFMDEHNYERVLERMNFLLIQKLGIRCTVTKIQSSRIQNNWDDDLGAAVREVYLAPSGLAFAANMYKSKVFDFILSKYVAEPRFADAIEVASRDNNIALLEGICFRAYAMDGMDIKHKAVREAIHMFLLDVSLADFRRYEIKEGLHKNMIAISPENLDRVERGIKTLRDHMDSYMKRKNK